VHVDMISLPSKTIGPNVRHNARAILSIFGSAALMLCAAACAEPANSPSNAPLMHLAAFATAAPATAPSRTGVILAFSGGGARSAAFGYGVLSALAGQRSPGSAARSLAEDVVAVAGVSGGGILAAHFALYGQQGLPGFRRDFLEADAEAALRTSYTPDNLLRAYRGGVNDLTGFAAWLDARLYRGATLGDLDRGDGPRLMLHATDLYNRAAFPFDRQSFRAICSDYDQFPLAHAVAASSAVPIAFAPVVLKNFNESCPVARRTIEPSASSAGQSIFDSHIAESQARYASAPELRYLKLLDGGLVDNLATSNLLRSMRQPAPEPLRAAAARHLRRVIVIVADASTRIGGDLSNAIEGPAAPDTIVAATDAMIDSTSRMSFDALEREVADWRDRLTRWRCYISQPLPGCGRLDVTVVRLSLADVRGEAERARIFQLHYKLSLQATDIDFLAGLGGSLLRSNPGYRRFVR